MFVYGFSYDIICYVFIICMARYLGQVYLASFIFLLMYENIVTLCVTFLFQSDECVTLFIYKYLKFSFKIFCFHMNACCPTMIMFSGRECHIIKVNRPKTLA